MSGFAKETDLCAAFLTHLPKGWTAYAETGGFDILLSRDADGFQIGVEAKLKLNAKVICQAAESMSSWHVAGPQPDCRAVLVPKGCGSDLIGVCGLLGITVVRVCEFGGKDPKRGFSYDPFQPRLPDKRDDGWREQWFERAPALRVRLPDYVPDTASGDSAPVKLTDWKIRAIKITVLLERRGAVQRADFKAIGIDMSRWINPHARWLVKAPEGWVAGPYLPDFRSQHPVNFAQIEASFDKWAHPPVAAQAVMI